MEDFVEKSVSTEARSVSTDEHQGYRNLGKRYNHGTVMHTQNEFVRGIFHTQTIDGFWSQLKRQIIGIHHFVSVKHLDRYVAESSWRYNRRSSGEGNRVNLLLSGSDANGKLSYKDLIA